MKKSPLAIVVGLALGALALPATANDISSTIAPQNAPQGCPIAIAISNDTLATTFLGQACPYVVQTAAGKLVYDIVCPTFAPTPIEPGGTFVTFWDTRDNAGNLVPAGDYVVIVLTPNEKQPHKLSIGNTKAGIGQLGPIRIATKRNFYLCSPGDPASFYLLLASFATAPGIPSCAGTLPLAPDELFKLSLTGSPALLSFFGVLSDTGATTDPLIALPNNPNLAGLQPFFAFFTFDLNKPCPILHISPALPVTIQKNG